MHSGRGRPLCPPVLHSVAAGGLPASATQIHSSGRVDSFSSHIPDPEKKSERAKGHLTFLYFTGYRQMLLHSLMPSKASWWQRPRSLTRLHTMPTSPCPFAHDTLAMLSFIEVLKSISSCLPQCLCPCQPIGLVCQLTCRCPLGPKVCVTYSRDTFSDNEKLGHLHIMYSRRILKCLFFCIYHNCSYVIVFWSLQVVNELYKGKHCDCLTPTILPTSGAAIY